MHLWSLPRMPFKGHWQPRGATAEARPGPEALRPFLGVLYRILDDYYLLAISRTCGTDLCDKKDGYGDGVRLNRLGLRSSRYRLMTPTNSPRENSIVLDVLIISLGAIVGANARYFLSRFAVKELGPVFPYGTVVINVLGSMIVGFFMIWTTERVLADPRWRLLVVVGFCGSFTTFSSYAFESMSFFDRGQWLLATANILSNNLLCLGAALAGMALARAL